MEPVEVLRRGARNGLTEGPAGADASAHWSGTSGPVSLPIPTLAASPLPAFHSRLQMAPLIRTRLLDWYDRARRDLPWRRTKDPWAIWVSEVMLQQTRVEAVRGHFERFLASYPTPAAFAGASEDDVLRAWRGLGYYRRARLLQRGAQAVVAEHRGVVPRAPGQLAELPGIGAYTQGAIASIAFGHALPAIDGNVERVVARHRGIVSDVKRGAGAAQVRGTVEAWLDRGRAGDFNQALMELGATVCLPRGPRCAECPIAADCVARRTHAQAELPRRAARPRPIAIRTHAVLVDRGGGLVLGRRIPAGEINEGQVELPGLGILQDHAQGTDLAAAFRAALGLQVVLGPVLATVRHAITRHRIELTVHGATCLARARAPLLEALPEDQTVPWSTTSRKTFARLGRGP